MSDLATQSQPWYRQWWAVTLLALGALVILFGGVIGSLAWYYLREIKAGREPFGNENFQFGFTPSISPVAVRGNVGRTQLETADDPSKGNKNAPVTVVEFIDFKCPNCKAAGPILADILARYPQKIRLIVRDFPAESIHPGASQVGNIGYCAAEQGKFWQFHDFILSSQDALPETLNTGDIHTIALYIGADADRLTSCAASPEANREVNEDYLTGVSAGVRGTPTFFINGEKVDGVVPEEVWVKYLDSL